MCHTVRVTRGCGCGCGVSPKTQKINGANCSVKSNGKRLKGWKAGGADVDGKERERQT